MFTIYVLQRSFTSRIFIIDSSFHYSMLAVSEDLIFLVYREVKNALTAVAVRTITGNTAYISTGFCIYSTPISSPIVLKIGSKAKLCKGIPKSSARSTAAATAMKNLNVYCPYILAFLCLWLS